VTSCGKQLPLNTKQIIEDFQVSVCLTTSADGTILPPFIIIPRKTPLPNYAPPDNVVVHYKNHGKTFDTEIIKEGILKRVLMPHFLQKQIKNPLVFADSAPCHKTVQVKTAFKNANIDYELIPPSMTKLVQPQDVSLMKAFKSRFACRWRHWFMESDKSFTRSGNMRSPSYSTIIDWISEIVREIPRELVSNSFDVTGIMQNDVDRYHSALRHILTTDELPITFLEDLDGSEDLGNMFVDNQPESETETVDDEYHNCFKLSAIHQR